MVLVDSGVWIDFFSGAASRPVQSLDEMLEAGRALGTTGIVLQEVLQGTRTERTFQLYRARLSRLPFLPASKNVHVTAAGLYRKLRARGVTVPSVDTLIAAVALEHDSEILTTDVEHFRAIAKVSKLRLLAAL